jgi:SAM-dependent methyltransferase
MLPILPHAPVALSRAVARAIITGGMDMERSETPRAIGRFTCNICGTANDSTIDVHDHEGAACSVCQSSMRFRAIILALSRALFGIDLKLGDFPLLDSLRGLGISDSDIYSGRLKTHFSYTNTFFDRKPLFDLTRPDEKEFGKYDFVICSDVLEHVPQPLDVALRALAGLLKPAGVLILTAPYSLDEGTVEHFTGLHETGLAEINSKPVLVNRAADGHYQVFDRLVFHGGQGSTLEMRVFSEADLRARLIAAGLSNVRFETTGNRELGVVFSSPCSLPIVASRAPFSLGLDSVRELMEQLVKERKLLSDVRESRWLHLGRLLGLGPNLER